MKPEVETMCGLPGGVRRGVCRAPSSEAGAEVWTILSAPSR